MNRELVVKVQEAACAAAEPFVKRRALLRARFQLPKTMVLPDGPVNCEWTSLIAEAAERQLAFDQDNAIMRAVVEVLKREVGVDSFDEFMRRFPPAKEERTA